MHIQERAMLVNLSVSCWTASKKDNKAGAAVKTQASATDKAGWFNKRLVDPEALKPISKVEGRIRDFHYRLTLPWGDNGDRILPAMMYMDYVDGLRAVKSEFEAEVATFVGNYPALVQSARSMLGAMYDPADYPTPESIKQRFDVRSGFMPIPDAADFRVDVGDDAVAEIKKSIAKNVDERLVAATKECWYRLDAVVRAMYTTLEDPERVFRDSLVDNIRELVILLPKMNLSGDKELDIALTEIRASLLVEPDSLRGKSIVKRKYRLSIASMAYDIWLQRIKPNVQSPSLS